jgi:hypothetical protein
MAALFMVAKMTFSRRETSEINMDNASRLLRRLKWGDFSAFCPWPEQHRSSIRQQSMSAHVVCSMALLLDVSKLLACKLEKAVC